MSLETGRRSRRRNRTLIGRTVPDTVPTGRTQHATGVPHRPIPAGPRSRQLTPIQGDVLALLQAGPRNLRELGEALNIEWSMAGWAADCLVNRGLAEVVADAPTRPTWSAT